jgi:hypothetical protein
VVRFLGLGWDAADSKGRVLDPDPPCVNWGFGNFRVWGLGRDHCYVAPHSHDSVFKVDPCLHHRWNMYDLLNNRTAWWAPGKIVELRRRLEPIWRVRTPAHAAQGLGVTHCHGLQRCTAGSTGPQ